MAQGPAELTNTGRVILGMIAEGHTTGYAVKAEIERSTRFFWGASIGGIYPELRRLEEAGFLTRSHDPRGEAPRHAYRLTAAGLGALLGWLSDTRESVIVMRNEGLLKLRFAGLLEPAQRLAVLERMRAAHAERIAQLESRLQAGHFDDPFHKLTTEYGLGWNRWARDWCDSVLEALHKPRRKISGMADAPAA